MSDLKQRIVESFVIDIKSNEIPLTQDDFQDMKLHGAFSEEYQDIDDSIKLCGITDKGEIYVTEKYGIDMTDDEAKKYHKRFNTKLKIMGEKSFIRINRCDIRRCVHDEELNVSVQDNYEETERRNLAQKQLKRYYRKRRNSTMMIRIGYTRIELREYIEDIRKSKQLIFNFENGDGVHCTSYTKEEIIAKIESIMNGDTV